MAVIHTILCPTDFSETARHAFAVATEIAREYDATIIVLHAQPIQELVEVPEVSGTRLEPPDFSTQERAALAAIQAPGLKKPLEHWLVQGDPAAVILRSARLATCDLIVMGARDAASGDLPPLGEVAARVVRQAPCTVLTVEGAGRFTLRPSQASGASAFKNVPTAGLCAVE